MTTKSTKKALLSSVLALFLCFTMLLGTTYAWFTDSVTSSNNIIKSGNLDVEFEYWDGASWIDVEGKTDILTNELWEPGVTEVAYLRVANAGSLALKYQLGVNIVSETEGKNVAGEPFKLSDHIMFGVVDGVNGETGAYANRDAAIAAVTGAKKISEGYANADKLASGDEQYFALVVYMPTTVGNEANHDGENVPEINLGLNIFATQVEAEKDSFGDDYDENATLPDIAYDYIAGGESIVAGNVEIVLPASSTEATYGLKVGNKSIVTDENLETTVSFDIDLSKDGSKVVAEAGTVYTVNINIGKGLVATGVTHNGAAVEGYSYNPSTGIITFTTDSFSPFTVSYSENVIEINSAEEFIAALTEIKTDAKQQIPGAEGNKNYRVNAIFVLNNDIVIDADTEFMYTDSNGAPLHFYGVRGVLDLNGHNITVSSDALLDGKTHANAVLLFQYSNVEIIGEGSIIANNKSIPVYAWANCSVNIYGGNYVTNASERNESAVYVNNATAKVNVYGGTYTESKYAFNAHDNCGSTPVIVLHEGIVYANFLKNGTTDVTASDISKGRIVIDSTCELVKYEENGLAMYKVVKK